MLMVVSTTLFQLKPHSLQNMPMFFPPETCKFGFDTRSVDLSTWAAFSTVFSLLLLLACLIALELQGLNSSLVVPLLWPQPQIRLSRNHLVSLFDTDRALILNIL